MQRKIISYALIGIGWVICLFFFGNGSGSHGYSGNMIPHPVLLGFSGIALMAVGLIILRSARRKKDNLAQKKKRNDLAYLKANGNCIRVTLKNCVVVGNDYTEEIQLIQNNSLQEFLLNGRSVFDESDKRIEKRDILQSVAIYECLYQGSMKKFITPVISKDKVSLTLLLEIQKETDLYVDKEDVNHYCFDLTFLDK